MLCDKDLVPIEIGDTVMKDGCLYVIRDFVVYEIAVEAVCEDKLTRNFKAFQLHEIIRIS